MIVIEVGEDEIRYTSTWLFGISKIPHNSLYLFGEVASAITNANGCKARARRKMCMLAGPQSLHVLWQNKKIRTNNVFWYIRAHHSQHTLMCALNPLPTKSLLQLPHFSINPTSSYGVIPCPIDRRCRICCSWLDTTPLSSLPPFCTCSTGSIALILLCSVILGTFRVNNAVTSIVNEQ